MRGFRRRRRLWRDKAGGEEKNYIKRRVERQTVFSSPPCNKKSVCVQYTAIKKGLLLIFATDLFYFALIKQHYFE